MKPKPASNILVTSQWKRSTAATRDQNEESRLLRLIALAHVNWKRKKGHIPAEAESEGQP